MKLGSGIRKLLRQPPAVRAIEREVDEELRFHVDTRIETLMSRGMTRQAAEAQVQREFGDMRAAHEMFREAHGLLRAAGEAYVDRLINFTP